MKGRVDGKEEGRVSGDAVKISEGRRGREEDRNGRE